MINVENNSTPDLNHDPAVDFTECVSLCPIQNDALLDHIRSEERRVV